MPRTQVTVFPSSAALAEGVAELFALRAIEAVEERGRFHAPLSGGTTPPAAHRPPPAAPRADPLPRGPGPPSVRPAPCGAAGAAERHPPPPAADGPPWGGVRVGPCAVLPLPAGQGRQGVDFLASGPLRVRHWSVLPAAGRACRLTALSWP